MASAEDLSAAANAAFGRGEIAAAAEGFLSLAAAFPDDKTIAYTAAAGLRACGDARNAAAVLERALLKSPGSVGILEALADDYTAMGMTSEATARRRRICEILEQAAASQPNDAGAWINLGRARTKFGQTPEAQAAYAIAGRLLLDAARTHVAEGQPAAAVALLRQVLAIDPGNAAAQALLRDAVTPQAAEIVALLQLAWAADQVNAFAEARENYETVLLQSPGHIFALTRLLTIDGIEGRLDDAEAHHRLLVESLAETDLAAVSWMHLSMIAYQHILRPLPHAAYKAVAAEIDRQLLAETRPVLKSPVAAPRRRLRVGYLSSYLRDHPIGHVTAALFAGHDREQFDIHVFYLPAGAPTEFTRTISQGAEHFITLPDTPAAIIETVAAHTLDILIYLDGYMTLGLLPVVAARPVPIQVFWLGHSGNCDISVIDYVIADDVVAPPEDEALYKARVARLPGTFHCASPHPIAPTPTRAEAGLPADGFVFCAFNNPEKIDRRIFEAWMRILGRVDGSVLWLSRTLSPAVVENLRAAAAALGIDGARLIFAPRVADKADHLARHRLCGLFLDTLTINASTTALDALWAGLPVITVPGAYFGSRLAASYLRDLGMDELVMPTLAAYEEQAVHLATHPADLRAVQTRLAANRESRPLFHMAAFCRKFEACLAHIHRTHAAPAADAARQH